MRGIPGVTRGRLWRQIAPRRPVRTVLLPAAKSFNDLPGRADALAPEDVPRFTLLANPRRKLGVSGTAR
eukprot:11187815-Lingulodinium_polyedra.AAC.1